MGGVVWWLGKQYETGRPGGRPVFAFRSPIPPPLAAALATEIPRLVG
jgi:hypothetical protein